MNKFVKIISKILEELGYGTEQVILQWEEISIYGYIKEQIDNTHYYIVSACKSQYFQNSDFEELQEIVYKKIKEEFVGEPSIEKNTSWLIGIEYENNYENIMNKILVFEENPYFFKKMVCPYSMAEVNAFFSEIGAYTNYIEYMQQEIRKVNRFVEFNKGQDNVYEFLSRLLIKIPSINLIIEKEKELRSLSDDIEDAIQEDELQEIYRFLQENIDEKTNMIDDNINALHKLYYGKDTDNE